MQQPEPDSVLKLETQGQAHGEAYTRKKSNSKERTAGKVPQQEPAVLLSRGGTSSKKLLTGSQAALALDEKQLQQIELVKQLIDITDLTQLYKGDEEKQPTATQDTKGLPGDTSHLKFRATKD